MISETIRYTIYGKQTSSAPVTIECKPDASVPGTISLSRDYDVYGAKVYPIYTPTGVDRYEASGPDISTHSILAWTGLNSSIDFNFTPSEINSPTGAQDGEMYGIKFTAQETGNMGTKSVSDVIVKINSDIEV